MALSQILAFFHKTATAPATVTIPPLTVGGLPITVAASPKPPANFKQAWADLKSLGDDIALVASGSDPTGQDFIDATNRLVSIMTEIGHPAPASVVDAIQALVKAEAFFAPYEPFFMSKVVGLLGLA